MPSMACRCWQTVALRSWFACARHRQMVKPTPLSFDCRNGRRPTARRRACLRRDGPSQVASDFGRRSNAARGAGENYVPALRLVRLRLSTLARDMGTRIIDGKTIAADLRGKVTDAVHRL